MTLDYAIKTPGEFEHGLRCPSCERIIKDGEPYAVRPHALDGETEFAVLTCVYCPAPDDVPEFDTGRPPPDE